MASVARKWAGQVAGRQLAAWMLLALACLGAPVQAALKGVPAEVDSAWRATGLPEESLSLVVRELAGKELVHINGEVPRNPASVMKLVTTWAALSELGPAHTWRTALLTEPGARPDEQGRLPGALYLRASGDPLFDIRDLWALLRELRLRGVQHIGQVVVDRSVFGPVQIDPGAFDGAGDRPYNASPDALVVGFGASRLLFLPDAPARKWRATMDPPLPGVRLEGEVEWSDVRCPGAPVVRTEPVIHQDGIVLKLSGKVAGSCGEFSLYRLALGQVDFAQRTFEYLWRSMGGTFGGQWRDGQVPPDAVLLAQHESPPLSDVIRVINKRSNNVMARMVLLALGVERGRGPATVSGSGQVAQAVLARQGLAMPELVLDNGAGLSRQAAVSADSLASLLDVAWRSPWMPEFLSSLAIVGVDGTVRRRLQNKQAQGRAHLKTGSLRDVRAIAGYVSGASGKRYIVVSIVNHAEADKVRAFDDALVAWLAER
ncbi:D-alanyl-D-alanine carboxypeptidase/D-alanyl-D-alanine-endopeptidase [Kerstersia gyiorum]|uniref:D-alanyl-D-alanine carboxypeptidase/D-alanyl-D-alanine-endopeptidase (Penicillin-binding protein 4) n=1 Tax=Kerstersia gyiorum TaxID=206506 RepID=A0A171KW47_9BURK|nr:D-alanyl-D-alanine carboxypeptidase/D-alanyl-D-alanine-endopeptidase [Bordetella sp. J329]KAB0545097.1 D-alanyl-D-alanine carboxypeptidase/D-alanyl-D-alanine-endopeptidase [Kerstersia gyiorum]KKO73114.1 peptidase M15 [Kerstersia gyiorum]MCP1632368.1 D-alanyl-D-alanine carboxypeptidase/D-alanyl-D-alanine-endopeptidase (penicillin-binding protein 4) [Kerstersia gyiorum]MCP1635125.1 D-alanyl-D-alanine carboxypeptidase/D-alanyl-D-alanine-endopeptidase (penicillin-binding protein 4) [Kerstersia g